MADGGAQPEQHQDAVPLQRVGDRQTHRGKSSSLPTWNVAESHVIIIVHVQPYEEYVPAEGWGGAGCTNGVDVQAGGRRDDH